MCPRWGFGEDAMGQWYVQCIQLCGMVPSAQETLGRCCLVRLLALPLPLLHYVSSSFLPFFSSQSRHQHEVGLFTEV